MVARLQHLPHSLLRNAHERWPLTSCTLHLYLVDITNYLGLIQIIKQPINSTEIMAGRRSTRKAPPATSKVRRRVCLVDYFILRMRRRSKLCQDRPNQQQTRKPSRRLRKSPHPSWATLTMATQMTRINQSSMNRRPRTTVWSARFSALWITAMSQS